MSSSVLLRESLQKMQEWFNKPLKAEQYELIVEKLSNIPGEAIKDICNRIIEEEAPTPGKFPTIQRIINGWYLWKKEHPEKVVTQARQYCKDCLGGGFFWFMVKPEKSNVAYEHVVRCASCQNWNIDVGYAVLPSRTRAELVAQGYEVIPSLLGIEHTPKKKVAAPLRNLAQKAVKPLAMESTDYRELLKKRALLQQQIDQIMKEEPDDFLRPD